MIRNEKKNKKIDAKKLAVRVICMILVGALLLTTILSMFGSFFY
jgi:F0F1-type ATP synthase assembly protein I